MPFVRLIALTFLLLVCSSSCAAQSLNQKRIARPSGEVLEKHFSSTVGGISIRWWRKFRNPSFCPFVLCGSSCADISGMPRIGAYTPSQLYSEITPCSLNFKLDDSEPCCLSHSIDTGCQNVCKDGTCGQ